MCKTFFNEENITESDLKSERVHYRDLFRYNCRRTDKKYSARRREEERQTARQAETEIGKGLEAQTARDRKNTLVNNATADSLFVT